MDISVQELKEKLDRGDSFIFLDVREPWEQVEFNLGAYLIPLGDLPGRISELEGAKQDEIIIHCRSGARSGMGQAMLQAQGFRNVRNLVGGAIAWQNAFGPNI